MRPVQSHILVSMKLVLTEQTHGMIGSFHAQLRAVVDRVSRKERILRGWSNVCSARDVIHSRRLSLGEAVLTDAAGRGSVGQREQIEIRNDERINVAAPPRRFIGDQSVLRQPK